MKIKAMLGVAIGLVAMLLLAPATRAAGTAGFSLAAGNYLPGASFSVAIIENSGQEGVNVVQSDLAYDDTKLQLVGIDTSQSSFTGPVVNSGSNGNIRVVRYNFQPLTGAAQVATLNFRVLANSGSSPVSFLPSSHIMASGLDIWDKSVVGATYTFDPPVLPIATAINPKYAATTPVSKTNKAPTAANSAKPLSATFDNKPTSNPHPVSLANDSEPKKPGLALSLAGLIVIGHATRKFGLHTKAKRGLKSGYGRLTKRIA